MRKRILLGVAVTAFLGIVAAWTLLMTQPGLRFAWSFAESRLPESLQVGEVSGRLVGPIALSGVRSENPGLTASVGTIRFDWRLRSLLARRVEMSTLELDDIRLVPVIDTLSDEEPEALPSVDLPVSIVVDHTHVRGISVDGRSTLGEIDSVTVHGFAAQSEWSADSLSVWAPEGLLRGNFTVQPRGDYPHRLSATFDAVLDSQVIAGSLEASGTVDSIEVDLGLVRPLTGVARGYVLEPRIRPRLELDLQADSTWLPSLLDTAPEAAVSGTVHASGPIDSIRLDGRATVWAATIPVALVDFDLIRRDSTIIVDQTSIEVAGAAIQANGVVVTGEAAPRFEVSGDWSNLAWPLEGETVVRSGSGRASLSGTADRYRVRVSGSMTPVGAPAGTLVLEGRGTSVSLAIDTLTYVTPAGQFTARGDVSWEAGQTARLDFAATDVVTEDLLPDSIEWAWKGSLAGRMHMSRTARLLSADVTVDTLSGFLSGSLLDVPADPEASVETTTAPAPVEASGSGSLRLPFAADTAQWMAAEGQLRWLQADVGTGSAFVSGIVGETIRIDATLDARDLSTVSDRASGAITGKARITGTRESPGLDVVAEAEGLKWDSITVESFVLEGVVAPEAGGVVDIVSSAANLAVGARTADSLSAQVRGTVAAHTLDARLTGHGATGQIGASGGIEDEQWLGVIGLLTLSTPSAGDWRLAGDSRARLSRSAVAVDTLCLVDAGSSVCGSASWVRDSTATGQMSIEGMDGARLNPFLPIGWTWDGAISGTSRFNLKPGGEVTGQAETNLTAGRLVVSTRRGPSVLATEPTQWTASVGEDGGQVDVALSVTDSTGLAVIDVATSISAPTLRRVSDSIPGLNVRGSFTAQVLDFSPIESAAPLLQELAGELSLDVALDGTVGRPELDGELDFHSGSFRIPDLGLDVTDVRLRATGAGSGGVTIDGALTSGTELVINGTVPQVPTAEDPARISLRGERLLALSSATGTALVSPNIDLAISPDRIGVGGVVRIPTADIEASEVPETAARPSPDVVFVDDSLTTTRRVPLDVELRIELGDSVQVSGFGFSGRPTGSITARDGTANQLAGTGEIILRDGQYSRFGQELDIVNGRLVYAGGPLDDPGLDVRATRTADDGVVAGLQIGGTLQKPVVSIFSEPAMLEHDALSYIVTGRPLNQASQSEGNRLTNVAASLGLREGNALATRLGQRFGLSDFRVEADGPLEEASLVAGRYLSPQLYVSYGVGLFEPVSTFRLRYLLSGRWTLLAESGSSAGVDLMYRVERGR